MMAKAGLQSAKENLRTTGGHPPARPDQRRQRSCNIQSAGVLRPRGAKQPLLDIEPQARVPTAA